MKVLIFSVVVISFLILNSCGKEKLTFKTIETKDYILEGYTYVNGTNAIFPNELVLIDKIQKDTIYRCENCYSDFHMILQDTLLIYGGHRLDSTIAHGIKLKKIPVPQTYKHNLPFERKN